MSYSHTITFDHYWVCQSGPVVPAEFISQIITILAPGLLVDHYSITTSLPDGNRISIAEIAEPVFIEGRDDDGIGYEVTITWRDNQEKSIAILAFFFSQQYLLAQNAILN